jgi:hypothetical protein
VASQFPTLTLTRAGESFPNETLDAVLAQGRLINGALYSVQIEAGKRNNSGLQIDFTGTAGDLKVTNTKSFRNVCDNLIEGARGMAKRMETLPFPDQYQLLESAALNAGVQDLAHLHAAYRDEGILTAPTFHEAVRMHRYIDAIVRSSETGSTISSEESIRNSSRPNLAHMSTWIRPSGTPSRRSAVWNEGNRRRCCWSWLWISGAPTRDYLLILLERVHPVAAKSNIIVRVVPKPVRL